MYKKLILMLLLSSLPFLTGCSSCLFEDTAEVVSVQLAQTAYKYKVTVFSKESSRTTSTVHFYTNDGSFKVGDKVTIKRF